MSPRTKPDACVCDPQMLFHLCPFFCCDLNLRSVSGLFLTTPNHIMGWGYCIHQLPMVARAVTPVTNTKEKLVS